MPNVISYSNNGQGTWSAQYDDGSADYVISGGGIYSRIHYPAPGQTQPAPGPGQPATSTATGVSPQETSYSLYGHVIPISVFGIGRIGGEIISGPWVENGLATFCISFGVPADPYGNRTLKEIAFDSEVVWKNGSFNTEGFTFRFYEGRLDQTADPIETARFGADGIAYRPQILIWFENLPLQGTKFGKIPYVAAVIADASGEDVNLGECFERIAYSPWCNYTPDDFETTNITDGMVRGGMILAEDAEFLGLIQQFGRFYRNWNILQTDKLRIVDRGTNVSPDVVLDRSTLIGQVVFSKAEPTSVPRVLELSTIDPDADYTIVPSKASRMQEPVNVSASISTESGYLPVIMDSSMRMSIVTYTKYLEDVARKTISITATMTGLEIEPGDLLAISGLGPDFENNTFKVVETEHGANYAVKITAESFFNCGIPGDPYWASVVLLLGFEGVDGSQGAPGFNDESPRAHGTAFCTNNPAIDTAESRFGASSVKFISPAPLVDFFDNDDWTLSSANADQFTIECWVRFSEIAATSTIVTHAFSPGNFSWGFEARGSEFAFKSSTDSLTWNVDVVTSGAGLGMAAWYHLAVDKDATGKIRLYKNGVMMGSATPANSSMANGTTSLQIGNNGWTATPLTGWIDELRITKGVARYRSDGGFVVSAAAWPRGEVL